MSKSAHDVVTRAEEDMATRARAKANQDEMDMAYFGKRQKLKRNFGMIPIIGLSSTIMITWQAELLNFSPGFLNGGPLGLICGYIMVWVGVTAQALVMAELGSMIPLAGGAYNWVAILAPPRYSKFLSYLTGWLTTIAWQAATAGAFFISANVIVGVSVLNNPTYEPQRWHTTLIFYALLLVSLFINTIGVRALPLFETGILIVHILGFFGILIPMVHLGPHGSSHDVFGTFLQLGLGEGDFWSSKGITFLIGATTTMFNFIGVEAATHMAEEIDGAAKVIPQSMLWATTINGVTGFGMLIGVLFVLGNVDDALTTPTGFPFMEILQNAVRSTAGATAMIIITWSAIVFAAIGALATASRMLWAFARERAVPGHSWISHVNPGSALPLGSIGVSVVVAMLLALVNIGSSVAFNALVSLTVAGFYASYMVAAGAILYRQLTNTMPIRWGPFRLGRLSVPINIFSLVYSVVSFVFAFFPAVPHPTKVTMNWSIVMFGGTLILALVYWFAHARKTYTGPRIEVERSTLDLREMEHHEHSV